MSEPESRTPFDVSPQDAVTTLERHDGPIIVDLDETLYLRNSTTEFLNTVRPRLLAYLVVKLIDVVRPWRGRGDQSHTQRDMWRVRGVLVCAPWSLLLWRRHAAKAGAQDANARLIDVLERSEGEVVVATLGYQPIVKPLLRAMGLGRLRLVAMSPWRSDDVVAGKLALTRSTIGADAVADSAVITDSAADMDLLAAARVGARVVWPEARPRHLFSSLYLPGRYLSVVKRPKSGYFRRQVIREDLALWIISGVYLADRPIAHIIGLAVLMLSFWSAYEIGYIDNDLIAEAHEADPKLTSSFKEGQLAIGHLGPVPWAIGAGLLGLWILRWPAPPSVTDYLGWAAVLVAVVAVFMVYNRFDKQTRISLFPLLHVARGSAFVVVAPAAAVAVVALVIHILIRSTLYLIYRINNAQWVAMDLSVLRLTLFVSGAVLLGVSGDRWWSELISATGLTLVAWHLLLTRREFRTLLRNAHRLDR